MLAHRSWWDESESLSVAIFDDRIEFTNPGHFPIGTSVEDFIVVPRSKPQNPDIANILFRSGWMESWGRGIIKAPWVTRIVFKFKNPLVPYISGEIDNDPMNEGLKGLSEMVKNTYHLIAINPGISVPQIAKQVGKGMSTIERHIAVLRKNGFVEHRDSKKGGGYYPVSKH